MIKDELTSSRVHVAVDRRRLSWPSDADVQRREMRRRQLLSAYDVTGIHVDDDDHGNKRPRLMGAGKELLLQPPLVLSGMRSTSALRLMYDGNDGPNGLNGGHEKTRD